MSSKAQVTIFIILGILIVGAIALFFMVKDEMVQTLDGGTQETNANNFMASCIEDKVKETIETISMRGGYVEPVLYKKFKFKEDKDYSNIAYLCYTQNYYLACVNQEPMLIQHLKDEIKDELAGDVRACFDDLVLSLENQGNVVDAVYRDFEIGLKPKKVVVEIDSELTLTKTGETSKQNGIDVIVASRFYDLVVVVQEIMSQEARFGHFENVGFMLFYPQFDIERFRTSDLSIIYNLKHRKSKEVFRFAVRGAVIPPGI